MTDTDHRPQLQAVDAGTEVQLDEGRGPARRTSTSPAARRSAGAIIPEHWRTREAAKRHVQLAAARHGHRAAYHGVRLARVRRHGDRVRGPGRVRHRLGRHPALVAHPRHDRARAPGRRGRAAERPPAAAQAGPGHPQGARHHPGRRALSSPWCSPSPWRGSRRGGRRASLAAAAVRGARTGGPAAGQDDHHEGRAARAGAAADPGRHHPGARARWASREINKAIAAGTFPPLPSPVREDGPGWRAEVDLPYGVTATQVIERREQLASGLRRPLGAVWPEPVTSEHAGRLELWVGRADMSKAKPRAVAAAAHRGGDVFAAAAVRHRRRAAAASRCRMPI